MDYSYDDGGFHANPEPTPYPGAESARWQLEDWAPELRFWARKFDPNLTEWLKTENPAAMSTAAAIEFAQGHANWGVEIIGGKWLETEDLNWNLRDPKQARIFINNEIHQLYILMQNDRAKYLDEINVQADGLAGYFQSFVNIDSERHPWTIELIRCGLAIGNLVYMSYKAYYNRIRPSSAAPLLLPPFGPPRHPAFPSGHSFLGHFIALFLSRIAPIAKRYTTEVDLGGAAAALSGKDDLKQPLFWLAARAARNRERAGLHYRSDSNASRHLAGGLFDVMFPAAGASTIPVPTLQRVLRLAQAEWY